MFGKCILIAGLAVAALNAAPPAFDVASVKISKAPDAAVLFTPGAARIPNAGGTVTLTNWSLRMCIAAAWDLDVNQMSGPAWLSTERYDIAAKTSAGTSQADLRLMLQELLTERFKLATHRESKEIPVYAIMIAKGGPRLRASTGDQHLPVIFAPPTRLIGQGSTLQSLASALRRAAGRPVIDKTGLAGTFDFTLSYSPDEAATDLGPSLFTALQEQLGLRLEPEKSPLETLVVDRAERVPTEN